jgi:two-component system response regulator DesR
LNTPRQNRPDVRVLCVDDNALFRRALIVGLRREPWITVVGELETPDELTARAAECRPDVVLLDLDMPGRDPFDAIEELRTTSPNARVLVLTGHLRLDFVDRAIERGAWGYLSKSVSIEQLLNAIREVASGSFVFGADVATEEEPGRCSTT